MQKPYLFLLTIIVFMFKLAVNTSADYSVVEPSAQLKYYSTDKYDPRVEALENFLNSHNSPLAKHADKFIEVADTYGLDWRLIPAISGVESTFGKNIPKNSYNAYGWANGKYSFTSWEESIETVGKTLKEKYIDRGALSINRIARRYAPPSSSWAWKVKFFMTKIEPLPIYFDLEG